MILLRAIRVDVCGGCRFSIEADGVARETSDPVKAAKILSHMGVSAPSMLVEHAQEWGSVEILEDRVLRH